MHPTVITMQSFLLKHINDTRRHEPSVVVSVVGGRLNSNSLWMGGSLQIEMEKRSYPMEGELEWTGLGYES